uniref:RNA-dependent RNA polymerase n=1 Tax=Niwlog virus TaxID=2800933 RepID=A0A894KDK2_9VIRU|nr:MAG: RNA-dependent RNA polymerase [Niwlog virus]
MTEILEDLLFESLFNNPGPIRTGSSDSKTLGIAGIPVPEVVVTVKNQESVVISFIARDDDEYHSRFGGSSFSKMHVDYGLGDWKLTNIVHDFTFGHILPSTDVRLDTIFKRSGSELTRFTPDFVKETSNANLIIEVGTVNSIYKADIDRTYFDKQQKYSAILQPILDSEEENGGNTKPVLFGLIIAGRNTVMTNLNLSDQERQEILMRFRVGQKIKQELIKLGLIHAVDESASIARKQLSQYFVLLDSISDPIIKQWEDDLISTIEVYKNSGVNESKFLEAHFERWQESRIKALINKDFSEEAGRKNAKVLDSTVRKIISCARTYETDGSKRGLESEAAHDKFEEEYLMRNQGNLKTNNKAIINIPFVVMQLENPDRNPLSELVLSSAGKECCSTYDALYLAAFGRVFSFPQYFPNKEMDVLGQSGWEEEDVDTFREGIESRNDTAHNLSKDDVNRSGQVFNPFLIDQHYIEAMIDVIEKDNTKQEELVTQFKKRLGRVDLLLNQADRITLAKVGVQGKGASTEFIEGRVNREFLPEVRDYRNSQKDWFDIRLTKTNDLDELLLNEGFMSKLLDLNYAATSSVVNWVALIEQARSLHGENFLQDKESNYLHWVSQTNMFKWAKMITDIGTEVDISLKQNCKKDEFVFKKLQDYSVWLLIKPTQKSDKIFFSILFKRDAMIDFNESTVFKKLHKLFNQDNYFYTEFISLNESKILNWVLTLPRLLGLFRFWCNFVNLEPYSEEGLLFKGDTDLDRSALLNHAMPMMMLSLIIGIADKTEVEEEITRTRYLVMESLSEWPIEPKPCKMVEKVSMNMRSRLTVWLYRKHRELSRLYSINPPRAREQGLVGQGQTETPTQLFWDGFINPYTGHSLRSGQQVINLFYLGYIKNKDEVAQANKISKLYDKILTYEIQYNEETAYLMGIKSPENPRPHCFDIELLVDSARTTKNKISNEYPDFLEITEKSLSKFLFETSVEQEFATLKASSSFDSSLYHRQQVTQSYSRSKVIEKLSLEKGSAVTVADLFKDKYKLCLNNRCLNIDIFKKPQHGGDREIYVLGFAERVVQRLIEQIARTYCGFIEEETMTHPHNKQSIPENTFRTARGEFRGRFITLNSSADASKWSQNNSSFKLLLVLLIFSPSYMHKTIIRCLRLWEFKKILINPQILDLFDKCKDLKFFDKTLQQMYDGYKGHKLYRWIKPGRPYIELTTGMMQGILHYSSSLYHSVILAKVRNVVECSRKRLQEILDFDKPFKVIQCHLQSSDDSFYSVSVPVEDSVDSYHKSRLLATIILQYKVDISSQMGVVNSIKTVLNSNHVYEFNSNFEFGMNHYKPDIKAIFSGFLVSEQELILTRQEELSVLLTTYLENGGTNYVANGLQLGQSYLHYHLMGLTTTRYFRTFSILQSVLPDPSLGFFLFDNPLAPGLMGFKYNLWVAVKLTNLGKLFKYHLRPLINKDSSIEETIKLSIELSAHGSLSPTYKLTHGNRKKWFKLLDRMMIDYQWREKIEETPDMMFRRSLTSDEVNIKISQKMHSPGVSASVSSLNSIPRILAESAYILKLRAVTSLGGWLDPRNETLEKVTILEGILKEIEHITSKEDISSDELKILFPFHSDFEKNQALLESVEVSNIGQSFREYKRKETSVEIATNNEYNLISLRGILLSFWFEDNPLITKQTLSRESREYILEQHKKIIPWISKSLKESLDQSPFMTLVDMFNWLNTFSGRKRVVRLLGTQIISRQGHSRLLSVVVNNLSSAYKLTIVHNEIEMPATHISSVRSKFHLLSCLPDSVGLNKQELMENMLSVAGNYVTFNHEATRSSQNDVVLTAKIAKAIKSGNWRGNDALMIINDMKRNKHGTIGVFTVRQKFSPHLNNGKGCYEGPGEWTGIIDGHDVRIRIDNNKETFVTEVREVILKSRLSSIETIAIRTFIKSMNWVIPNTLGNRKTLLLSDLGVSITSGVPITIKEDLTIDVTALFKLKISLEWTGRNLRCVAKDKRRSYTVISLSPKQHHADYHTGKTDTTTFMEKKGYKQLDRSWVWNQSLSVEQANKLIKDFNAQSEERQELIRLNLKSKLENLGVTKFTPPDLISLAFVVKEEPCIDVNDFVRRQLKVNVSELNLIEDISPDIAPDAIDEEEEDRDNVGKTAFEFLESLGEQLTSIEVLKREAWRSHRLFKCYADFLVENLGLDDINGLITRREYPADLNFQKFLDVFEILLQEPKEQWVQREVVIQETVDEDDEDEL